MEGVDHYDGDLVLLTHTPKQGLALARGRKNIRVVSWMALNHQLQGLQLPIAIDNGAMAMILTGAIGLVQENRSLKESNASLIRAHVRQAERIERLTGSWPARMANWLMGLVGKDGY
jgi:hypothetical protein